MVSKQRGTDFHRLKICFVGNTNNYPFLIASAMRQMGHDVTVLLDRPESLHRPEGRYNGFDLYKSDWIRDVSTSVSPERWTLSNCPELETKTLGNYDLLVLNGFGPTLVGRTEVPAFSILTGSDLTQLANWSSLPILWRHLFPSLGFARTLVACALNARIVYRQRRSIRSSFGVSYFMRGVVPEADCILDGLGVRAEQRISFMLSDVDHIKFLPPPVRGSDSPVLRIFNVARLNWRQPKPAHLSELDMKGTDILLAGYAAFLNRIKRPAQLVLVRKGYDVTATEQEVLRLGIGAHVLWLNEMSQAEVFEQYALADVVTEQFSTSYVGMGGLDAMAAGRPVIANTRPDTSAPELLADSPVLHAATPEEVCAQLMSLADSVEWREKLGEQSRHYVERRHSPLAAATRILAMHAGRGVDETLEVA